MSTVNPVSAAYQQSTDTGTTTTSSSKELGKTEFLQLLIAQLKNQDPMNPMDNGQFISQMATFSSLEQLISINQGIDELVGSIQPEPNTTNNGL